jgi:alpha-tubulin suppressor-like RCC1 family protein
LSFGSSKIDLSTIQEPIKDVSCGSYHCYFTTNKGELLGVKDEKALGLQLPEFQIPFSKITTGDIHSLVLTKEGNLAQFFFCSNIGNVLSK